MVIEPQEKAGQRHGYVFRGNVCGFAHDSNHHTFSTNKYNAITRVLFAEDGKSYINALQNTNGDDVLVQSKAVESSTNASATVDMTTKFQKLEARTMFN